MDIVRDFDHLLGESWCIEDCGLVLGMFFGPDAKTRAEKRLGTIKYKPMTLQRTLEARGRLLAELRKKDIQDDRRDKLYRYGLKREARERRARQRQ